MPPATQPVSAVLLGAGYGTRLYPLTQDRPKALLPIGSTTILDLIVDDLLTVPGLADNILVSNRRFVQQFHDWERRRGAGIEILDDGSTEPDNRLGAIRDLKLAVERARPDADLLVLGTDNLFDWRLADFTAFAQGRRPASSVAVREVATIDEARRCGIGDVGAGGRITRVIEKPKDPPSRMALLCVYYFPLAVRGRIDDFLRGGGNADAPGFFMEYLAAHDVLIGWPTPGEWFDIGTPDSYRQAVEFWSAAAARRAGTRTH